jgi:uncharacterized protein (TIGR02186 family)
MLQRIVLSLVVLLTTLLFRPAAPRAEEATMRLDPPVVRISAFYNGTDLTITGEVPADAEVLVRLTGEHEDVTLKKKGKVGGLLWMNVAEITLKNAPSVSLLYTSKNLGAMATAANTAAWDELGLGFDAIKRQLQVVAVTGDKEVIANDFMKMKNHEGLYDLQPDAVRFADSNGPMKAYSAVIHVPPRLKPGAYQVDVLAVSGDRIVASAGDELNLVQVGFPAFLSSMAFGQSLLYGIMSVAIAIFGGLGMSMVFRSKGGAH